MPANWPDKCGYLTKIFFQVNLSYVELTVNVNLELIVNAHLDI